MGSSSHLSAMGRYGGQTWSERRGSTRAGSELVGMGVGVSFLPSQGGNSDPKYFVQYMLGTDRQER